MLFLNGRGQDDDLQGTARRERKAILGRPHICEGAELASKPPDFDAQSRSMRFIGIFPPECACDESIPRDIPRPALT
jgi:hypothetical protein